MDSMDEELCPICVETLDASDRAVNYCDCGYRICMFCWKQLMETAANDNLAGRCPNCRSEYDVQKITMSQVDPEIMQEEKRRRKDRKDKGAAPAAIPKNKKELQHIRVVQRNLVYTVGLPLSICREEMLSERHYFGQYGKIKKVSVNRQAGFAGNQGRNGPTGSAYVTFYRNEDAAKCIAGVDNQVWEGKTIKACFGTTKYCNAFLKGVICNNPECLYLHDIADDADSFHKDDMQANGLIPGAGIGDFFAAMKAPAKGLKAIAVPVPLASSPAVPLAAPPGPSMSAVGQPSNLKMAAANPWNASNTDGSNSSPMRGTWAAAPPRPLPPPIGLSEEWPSLAPAAKDDPDDDKSRYESGEYAEAPKTSLVQSVKAAILKGQKAAVKGAGSKPGISSHPTILDAGDFTPGTTPPDGDGKGALSKWKAMREAAAAAAAPLPTAHLAAATSVAPKDVPITDQAAQQLAGRAAGKEGRKGKAAAKAAAQAPITKTDAIAGEPSDGPAAEAGGPAEDMGAAPAGDGLLANGSKVPKKGPPPGFASVASARDAGEASAATSPQQALLDPSDPVVYPHLTSHPLARTPSSSFSDGPAPSFSHPSPAMSAVSSATLANWGKDSRRSTITGSVEMFDLLDPSVDAPVAMAPPTRSVGGLMGLQSTAALRGPPPGFAAPVNASSQARGTAYSALAGHDPLMSDASFDVNAFFNTSACLDPTIAEPSMLLQFLQRPDGRREGAAVGSRVQSRWTFAQAGPPLGAGHGGPPAAAAAAQPPAPTAAQPPHQRSGPDQQDMLKFFRTIAPSANVHLAGKEQAPAVPHAANGTAAHSSQAPPQAPTNPGFALLQQLRGGHFAQAGAAPAGGMGALGDPAIVVLKAQANAEQAAAADWQAKMMRSNTGYGSMEGMNMQRLPPRGPPPGFAGPASAQMPPPVYAPQHMLAGLPGQRPGMNPLTNGNGNMAMPPGGINVYNTRA